jgi:predicted DNA-binding transcriptional regulator AlpA
LEIKDRVGQKRQVIMEEYLTVNELSARIKFSKQTLYNLIYKGTFVIGKHYLKPSHKKILFKWSEIHKWMKEPSCSYEIKPSKSAGHNAAVLNSDHDKAKSSINI